MDEKLNHKIIECYNISNLIIDKYAVLLKELTAGINFNNNLILEIRDLVMQEYEIYDKLEDIEINNCLKELESINYMENEVGMRFQRKLEILIDKRENGGFLAYDMGLDICSSEYEFNLFSSIISFIDIEMMSRLIIKLGALNYDDKDVVNSLYERFYTTLFSQIMDNELTEMILLNNNMRFDNINLNINKLFDMVDELYPCIDNVSAINTTIYHIASITIERIAEIGFDYSANNIFDNLAFITRIELLIEYMSIDNLRKILNECEILMNKNSFGIKQTIELIKKRFG